MSLPRFIAALTLGVLGASAQAQTGAPPELARWQDWVQAAKPERLCPIAAGEPSQHICHFPAELTLDIHASGAQFQQRGERFAAGLVELIGSEDNWPQAVRVNGQTAVVTLHDGKPVIALPAGRYQIEGLLQWQTQPSALPLPNATGLVQLRQAGAPVAPRIEANQLLLGAEAETVTSDADQTNVRIYRLLEDKVPQRLTTVLDIDAAGRDRQFTTGKLLLEGFAPIALQSELPATLNNDGSVTLQLRPGRFQLTLAARALHDTAELAPAAATEGWPSEELWSVAEDLSLRQLQLGGASQVDPQQTELPAHWRHLPAFIVTPAQPLTLQTLQQGREPQTGNSSLQLQRTLWLDFDGKGFTSRERIDGQFAEPTRLYAANSYQLGNSSVNGKPQVITHLPDQKDKLGIAVQAGQQQIETSGRGDNWQQFSASGWQHGFAGASAELHLPPGWQLLHAQGVDSVSNSWLARWNLWAIFLVVIVAATSWQVFGASGAVLAALAFVLSFHSQPLLAYTALACLLTHALTRALPANRLRQSFALISAGCALLFTLISLPFFVQELRAAFYPQLAQHHSHYNRHDFSASQAPEMEADVAAASADEMIVMAAPEPQHAAAPRLAKSAAPRPALDTSLERLGNAQTGPALPHWQWAQAELRWNGPITAEQQVRLWALPPWATLIWRISSVLLVGCFLGLTLLRLTQLWRVKPVQTVSTAIAPAALALLMTLAPTSDSYAAPPSESQQTAATTYTTDSFPSPALLQELSDRLDAQAEQACPAGQCASLEKVSVTLQATQLTIELRAHAARPSALPLPAQAALWLPQTIKVNGEASSAFKQDDTGQLWLALAAGSSDIQLQGSVARSSLALPFALGAPNLQLTLDEVWQAQGLRDGRLNGRELLLSRRDDSNTNNGQSQANQQIFPSFVQVERRLELGSQWQLTTTVQRIAPELSAIHLTLPLLVGESVINAAVEVKDGAAHIALAADQQVISWQSLLPPAASLTLTAADNAPYAERWVVVSEPIWQVDYQGLNPLNEAGNALAWQPRAGDSVTLNVASPIAAAGPTHTIDSANLRLRPGARAADSQLDLVVRATAGGLLPITLPAGSELLSLHIDGREQQLSVRDGKLNLPLTPGSRSYQLNLRQAEPQGLITRTPVIDTASPLNNIELTIEPPANRWILAVSGPLLGPAITYWGVLLVIVAAAILLGRWAWLPFGAATWLVLGIGMSTVNAVGSLWVVAWFIALRWRAGLNTQAMSAGKLQWLQIGLALLTVIAGWQLLATIPVSLLSQPEMMIGGYNSSSHSLNWYQDHAASMPVAEVVSLPLWVYRALMLGWSLWLAVSLLKFARFGWQAFSSGELWRAKPPKPKAPLRAGKRAVAESSAIPAKAPEEPAP